MKRLRLRYPEKLAGEKLPHTANSDLLHENRWYDEMLYTPHHPYH